MPESDNGDVPGLRVTHECYKTFYACKLCTCILKQLIFQAIHIYGKKKLSSACLGEQIQIYDTYF
jgi:hypothetical protein